MNSTIKKIFMFIFAILIIVGLRPNIAIAATKANHIDLRFSNVDFDRTAKVTAIIDGERFSMFLEKAIDDGMQEYRVGSNMKTYLKDISIDSEIEFEVVNIFNGKKITRTTGVLPKSINQEAFDRCYTQHWTPEEIDQAGMDFIFDYQNDLVNGPKYEVQFFYSNDDGTYPDSPDFTEKHSGVIGSRVSLTSDDYFPKKSNYHYDNKKTAQNNSSSGILGAENTDENPLVLRIYFKSNNALIDDKSNFYSVQWFDAEDNKEIRIKELRIGRIDSSVSVTDSDKKLKGYVFDTKNANNVLSDVVKEYPTTALKLYFAKASEVDNSSNYKNNGLIVIEKDPVGGDNDSISKKKKPTIGGDNDGVSSKNKEPEKGEIDVVSSTPFDPIGGQNEGASDGQGDSSTKKGKNDNNQGEPAKGKKNTLNPDIDPSNHKDGSSNNNPEPTTGKANPTNLKKNPSGGGSSSNNNVSTPAVKGSSSSGNGNSSGKSSNSSSKSGNPSTGKNNVTNPKPSIPKTASSPKNVNTNPYQAVNDCRNYIPKTGDFMSSFFDLFYTVFNF